MGYFLSTIGRKQMMALTGLGLAGFLLTHVLGNMLILVGAEAYNKYSHALVSNPLIYVAEVGLLGLFLFAYFYGRADDNFNFSARPKTYAKAASGDKATSLTTRTMWMQGIVILFFVISHLVTLKYGTHYEVQYAGVTMRDLFKLVSEVFRSPGIVSWYVVAMTVLTFHLSHGVYSSLQTLGLNHPKYTPKFKIISVLYGVLVCAGFISQPLYIFFIYKG